MSYIPFTFLLMTQNNDPDMLNMVAPGKNKAQLHEDILKTFTLREWARNVLSLSEIYIAPSIEPFQKGMCFSHRDKALPEGACVPPRAIQLSQKGMSPEQSICLSQSNAALPEGSMSPEQTEQPHIEAKVKKKLNFA